LLWIEFGGRTGSGNLSDSSIFRPSAFAIIALVLGCLLGLASPPPAAGYLPGVPQTSVIVELEQPPLGAASGIGPGSHTTSVPQRRKLDMQSLEVKERLSAIAEEHSNFRRGLFQAFPGAIVSREFNTAFNGLAVSVPASRVDDLKRMPGVKKVYPSRQYRPVLYASVPLINAPVLWDRLGGALEAGRGMKIAILDTGIDQTHPFLTDDSLPPAQLPPGRDAGDSEFTTRKVIVAKLYTPPGVNETPWDDYGHGTHVAGIAAGIPYFDTRPYGGSVTISGVAPMAYLMNYKVMYPDGSGSAVGDTPEVLQAIDDAVLDGADVVNMSFGGSAESLSDDPLLTAIHNGSQLGVVFVVAAGNGGSSQQTITSPGTSPEAITVGASDDYDALASFSSRGPNLDLSIKPDVTAPGVYIYSSLPSYSFGSMQGTSMATPHVSGAAALLKQLYPSWMPAQIKSALVNTAKTPVYDASGTDAPVMGRGGGRIDLAKAMDPGLLLDPPSYSFGMVNVAPDGVTFSKVITATDVTDSGGTWTISATQTVSAPGLDVRPSTSAINVPSNGTASFSLTLSGAASVPPGDYEGYVALQQGTRALHIPYFARVVHLPYKTHLPLVIRNGQLP